MISVITPVYNGKGFIESCIKVVIEQNCPNAEHLIIDGGSTDGTVEIIKQYAEKYPHIRWISEKDKGQSDAMNKGIAMARGEILAILNVDDYYEPNVLNRILEIFKSLPEPTLLVGNCNVWDDEGRLIHFNKPTQLEFSALLLAPYINAFPMNPSAYFYHTSLHQKVGLYKVDEHYTMDYDFILKAVQAATAKYVDETWGNYRLIEGTKTRNDEKSGQSFQRLEHLLTNYRRKLPLLQRWKIAFTREFCRNFNQFRYYLHRVKHYFNEPEAILIKFQNRVN
ncbi:MAG: glycosyltransferase [Scytonema sp. RU_4_4]|nr:glycosyltransferase [Scytonema sp. RU_4_4]NJR75777.1 glycosyltransferase [Scytonema sp. CRU_2_7]